MSQSHITAPKRRSKLRRESASTAAGIAAERVTLADRDRERRTSHARLAARQLNRRGAQPRP